MTEELFESQIKRLRTRFGLKAFDNEFARLLASELKELNDVDFLTVVNRMIAERPHTRPPIMADFREARVRLEQMRFNQGVEKAATNLFWPAGALGRALKEHYPGAKDLKEAMEIQILRNQIKRANGDSEPDSSL